MKYLSLIAVTTAASVCSAQLVVTSGPVASARLSTLIDNSDAVVVAGIRNNTFSAGTSSVTIEVLRSLRGPLLPGARVFLPWSLSRNTPNVGAGPYLWFLTAEKGGHRAPLPYINPAGRSISDYLLPVSKRAPKSFPTLSLNGRLAAELRSTAEIIAPSDRSLLDSLLMSATLLPDSSSFTGVFNGLANSPAANDQALGISSLILQGNAEGYAKLAANPSLRRSPEGVALFSGVLCAAPSDKVQVAVVASLLEEVPLARCASYLLRANHSKETLPHLAKLLDHTLKEMRYEGLMGLAAFANNFPMMTPANQASMAWKTPLQPAPYSTAETRANMPTPNTFAAREGRYINFWKGWWQQHETELTK